jgi:hypothetical protein
VGEAGKGRDGYVEMETAILTIDQVAKATLVEGGDQSFSQEKILTVDKYEVV